MVKTYDATAAEWSLIEQVRRTFRRASDDAAHELVLMIRRTAERPECPANAALAGTWLFDYIWSNA